MRLHQILPIFCLLLLLASPGCSSPPRQSEMAGVENFSLVSPDVWRGAEPTAAGWAALQAKGMKTALSLRESDDSTDVPAGVKVIRVPTSALRADRVNTEAVLSAIAASPKPIFIHCHQGRDRTGLAVAAYQLSQGIAPEVVMAELYAHGVNWWWRGPIERRIGELAMDAAHPPH
jgi:tyrosine-protein phosphatase SIW14